MDERRFTGIARLDEAVARIADAAVADGLCEAVILKGSIARGDADEFSDVDLYLVVSPQNRDAVLERRERYLAAYGDIVFIEDVDFGLPQKVAIFSDALHVDLYVAEPQQVGDLDPIEVWFDPRGLFDGVAPTRTDVTDEELGRHFSSVLYSLVEASSAYARRNDAWAAKIMSDAAGELSVLVRSLYDRRYAFLGLKKINEVIPAEDYRLLEDVYARLGRGDFLEAAWAILDTLDAFLANAEDDLAAKLDARFLSWAKDGMGTLLFAKRNNVLVADVPISSPSTYEEFCAQFCVPLGVARAEVPDDGLPIRWWPDHEIVPGVRSGAELCDWLESSCDVKLLSESNLSQVRRWSVRWNIEHGDLIAEHPDADLESLDIAVYRLLPTERNRAYFMEGYGDPEVLIERQTGYCEVGDSVLLSNELTVAGGVSVRDIEEVTPRMWDYLECLHRLEDPTYRP